MPNNNQSEEVERIVGELRRNGCSQIPSVIWDDENERDFEIYEWLRQVLTTHGASEYARGKSEALANEGFTSIEELEAEGDWNEPETPFEIEMQ